MTSYYLQVIDLLLQFIQNKQINQLKLRNTILSLNIRKDELIVNNIPTCEIDAIINKLNQLYNEID